MRIGMRKRFASGITAAAMAFSYLMPFQGLPVGAADSYTLKANFLGEDGTTPEALASDYANYT